MKMRHLIEHYERELSEISPETIIRTGQGVALAIMTSPAWAPVLGNAFDAASGAAIDLLPKRKNRFAIIKDTAKNKNAEQCYKSGGKDCTCADGFHYDRDTGKCMKNTLGSGIKRFFKKK